MYNDRIIETMWEEFEDVPFDSLDDGTLVLAEDFMFFTKGTDRDEIWNWFDRKYSKGLKELLDNYEGQRAILVYSNGESISEERYASVCEASQAMREAYESAYPDEADEITEMSDLRDREAVLYRRGRNVQLWKVIEL